MTNLTGRAVYQKDVKISKTNRATPKQRARWERLRALGCIIGSALVVKCDGKTEIHHCETGIGRRKNHDKVIPLCQFHHGLIQKMGRPGWETVYGTEQKHMERVKNI